jgi:hypothetical protein
MTGQASSISTASAVVSGVASNPDLAGASVVFQYGTTTTYGASTPPEPVGATTTDVQLSASLTGLAPATTYHFRIVTRNAAGTATGADRTLTTSAPPTVTGPSGPVNGGAPPAAPTITNLTVTPATLSLTRRATATYTDTQAALTAFTLQRPVSGRLDGHSCSTPTKRNQGHRHCTVWVNTGTTLTHADTPGSDHFVFTPHLLARALPAGRYRLQATPHAHGLTGHPQAANLRVIATRHTQRNSRVVGRPAPVSRSVT